MIGHTNGNNIVQLMQTGDNIHFFLHRICLDNRYDLTIREYAMDLNTAKCGNLCSNPFCFAL